jgi:hypothetical protein
VTGITLAWLTTLGIGTWRWEQGNGTAVLPPPALYVGPALAFSILGLAAQVAPKPAALFAWGMVIAAAINGDFGKPPKAVSNTAPPLAKAGKVGAAPVSPPKVKSGKAGA